MRGGAVPLRRPGIGAASAFVIYSGAWLVSAVMLVMGAACGSSAGKTDGGSMEAGAGGIGLGTGGRQGGSGGQVGTGSGGIGSGGSGSGGTGADGGPEVAPFTDCFPDCLVALRRNCERPAFGAGTCGVNQNGSDTVYCYSNGVREIRSPLSDGGVLTATFTMSDGKTPCYSVVASSQHQSFLNLAGEEIAQLEVIEIGRVFRVTCAGSSIAITVDSSSPGCRSLDSADCTSNACP